MQNTGDYVRDIKEIGAILTGKTAPKTGEYYAQIYSQKDPQTGVPTLGVTLVSEQKQQSSNKTSQTLPTKQNTRQNTAKPQTEHISQNQDAVADAQGSSIPIGGIFIFALLLALVGFLYFIIRAWQNHKARTKVLLSMQKDSAEQAIPIEQAPELLLKADKKEPSIQVQAPIETAKQPTWRTELEQANKKLLSLLEQKGIVGETVADKLKSVKPGQFSLADMAWEAQNGAKQLLTAHDSEVKEAEYKRTMQFFTQVFAKNT